jgi:hypothetical protein
VWQDTYPRDGSLHFEEGRLWIKPTFRITVDASRVRSVSESACQILSRNAAVPHVRVFIENGEHSLPVRCDTGP